ncbi:MAG: YbaB/EbfC family nucleoid-associated protein [Abditibacteriota bacterium]|nr:YbaB/EbfC family nucleoid-associated protein [Abditibacteriota bacterium]
MAKGRNNFGGFGAGMNMQNMMKQAQKMLAEQEKIQEELNAKIYEASSGGGMVTAKVNGSGSITELVIKPECVDPEDVEMLQDMIISAVNEAVKQAKEAEEAQLSQITGGLNIPGLKF